MKESKDLNRYLRDVSKIIPIKGKDKRDFIKALKQRILDNDDYLENMSYEEIEDNFGTAKQIGISFLDDVDNEALLNKINFSLIIKRLAIVITVVVCLSFVCASAYRVYRLECLYEQAMIDTDLHENTKIEYNSVNENINEEEGEN